MRGREYEAEILETLPDLNPPSPLPMPDPARYRLKIPYPADPADVDWLTSEVTPPHLEMPGLEKLPILVREIAIDGKRYLSVHVNTELTAEQIKEFGLTPRGRVILRR